VCGLQTVNMYQLTLLSHEAPISCTYNVAWTYGALPTISYGISWPKMVESFK